MLVLTFTSFKVQKLSDELKIKPNSVEAEESMFTWRANLITQVGKISVHPFIMELL